MTHKDVTAEDLNSFDCGVCFLERNFCVIIWTKPCGKRRTFPLKLSFVYFVVTIITFLKEEIAKAECALQSVTMTTRRTTF